MHTHKSAHTFVFWYAPAVLTCCFIIASIVQVRYFNVQDMDFSYFLIQPWSLAQGYGWDVPFSVLFDQVPFYMRHVTPLSALLAPIFGLFPSPYTLTVIHGLACGVCAFVLPRLVYAVYDENAPMQTTGAHTIPPRLYTAAALMAIFAVYPPFIVPWYNITHYTTLVTPFVFLALWALHKRRLWAVGICCLMLALGQERASITIFGVGMYAFLLLRMRTLGVILCALSTIWFFTATQVYIPWLLKHYRGDTAYTFMEMFAPLAYIDKKLILLFLLALYTLFLPFCGKKAVMVALCALPNLGINLVSNSRGMVTLNHQYSDLPSAFLLCSAIYGLHWLQGRDFWARGRHLITGAIGVYMVLVLVTVGGWYSPYLTTYRLLTQPQKAALDLLDADMHALQKLPEGITLYAQAGLGPRLSLHKGRQTLSHSSTKHDFTHDINNLNTHFHNSLLVLSPLCGRVFLEDYPTHIATLDANPSLDLVLDNGRVRIYASKDVPQDLRDVLKQQLLP